MLDVYGGVTVHTKDEFVSAYEHVVNYVDGIHVDFADGVFAPNTLLTMEETPLMNEHFAEAHLMVKDPLRYFDLCARKSFKRIIFHPSSLSNTSDESIIMAVMHGQSLGMQVWIALELEAEIPAPRVLAVVDGVLVMTVKLGFSGGAFEVDGLVKARKLVDEIKHLPIGIDGGVNDQTIAKIRATGANHLVSTSWLQLSENVGESVNLLKKAEESF